MDICRVAQPTQGRLKAAPTSAWRRPPRGGSCVRRARALVSAAVERT